MTPLREFILDEVLQASGPQRKSDRLIMWQFYRYDRHDRWRRKYVMHFEVERRAFTIIGARRTSKRTKRIVKVSDGMVAYLRSRLPPEDIARCMAMAIAYETPNPDDIPF